MVTLFTICLQGGAPSIHRFLSLRATLRVAGPGAIGSAEEDLGGALTAKKHIPNQHCEVCFTDEGPAGDIP